MQRKRTPKGLSAAARQPVDDHCANPCPELISRHPEIAGRLDVHEHCWVATQDLPVRKAAKVVGKGLSTIDEWGARSRSPANLETACRCPTRTSPNLCKMRRPPETQNTTFDNSFM